MTNQKAADFNKTAGDAPEESHSSNDISQKILEEALKVDKGRDANLLSWITKDFTAKGDNYVSIITSVIVKFTFGSDVEEVTYVVKIKQATENGSVSDFDSMVFNKEGRFFSELLPQLNSVLADTGQELLKMPHYLHTKWLEDQNQIFLNDLRVEKYRLYDRKKGLDFQHTKVTLRELSKLHAASLLLQNKRPKRQLHLDFKFLNWEWFTYSKKLKKAFEVLVTGGLITASMMAKEIGKDKVAEWFQEISSSGVDILEEQLVCNSPCFNLVGHGDCWINNLLFKYDERGIPIDVQILDLQFCRQSSLATDLTYFFFTSLERDERRGKLNELLSTYYSSFKEVMEAAKTAMPFSVEELLEEYHKRNLFGLIMSSLLLPNILCNPEDVQEFDAGADGCAGGYIEKKRLRSMRMLQNNGIFRKRMLDLFEDVAQIVGLT